MKKENYLFIFACILIIITTFLIFLIIYNLFKEAKGYEIEGNCLKDIAEKYCNSINGTAYSYTSNRLSFTCEVERVISEDFVFTKEEISYCKEKRSEA